MAGDYFSQVLKPTGDKGYLGDVKTVNSLLRGFAQRLLTGTFQDDAVFGQAVDQSARVLANVFLGKDKQYPGPKWFSPGQIDVHVARRTGIQSKDPVERVAGGLLAMLEELFLLSHRVSEEKLIDEQWQGATGEIIEKYANMLLGIPEGSGMDTNNGPARPVNKLPQ